MKLKDTLGKHYLIVRELDQETGEMGQPVEIVEIEKDIEDLEKLSENPDNDALFYALYKLSLSEHICEWEDLRKRYPVGKYGVENCSTSDIERWDNLKD